MLALHAFVGGGGEEDSKTMLLRSCRKRKGMDVGLPTYICF